MSESMNFGNLGFSTVTEEEKKVTPVSDNVVEEVEEVEVDEDEEFDLEEKKRKDA